MMRQQEILKKIGGIIAELKDQYTYLETAGSNFNELELELFMANAHFLTDHIGILQKISLQPVPELTSARPVLQLEETPLKPVIPDYFDEQDLLSAESVRSEKDTIKTAEVQADPILPVTETIILPETMPQTPVDLSPQENMISPVATPETEVAEDDKPDASFIDPKLETVDLQEESSGQRDTTSAEPSKPDASFIDPKLETVDLQEESFEQSDTTSAEPSKQDASFIDPKLETADLREESFGLNPVTTQPAARPETLSMSTQQSAASDFSISSGRETKSTTEPAALTLNDRIAAQKDDQLKAKPDQPKTNQDLQSMISLNDKLLFVKELFNGYNLAYAEAVNILNRYTNFEQAESFLNLNYAAKNNWKEKPVTTEKFMDLLRKKLG